MSISDVSAHLWHQLQPGTLLYLPARLILLLLLAPLQSHRNCLKGTVLGKLSTNSERKSVDVFSLSPSHIPDSPRVCLFSLDAQFWEAFYMRYCLRKWSVSLKSKQKGPEQGQDSYNSNTDGHHQIGFSFFPVSLKFPSPTNPAPWHHLPENTAPSSLNLALLFREPQLRSSICLLFYLLGLVIFFFFINNFVRIHFVNLR